MSLGRASGLVAGLELHAPGRVVQPRLGYFRIFVETGTSADMDDMSARHKRPVLRYGVEARKSMLGNIPQLSPLPEHESECSFRVVRMERACISPYCASNADMGSILRKAQRIPHRQGHNTLSGVGQGWQEALLEKSSSECSAAAGRIVDGRMNRQRPSVVSNRVSPNIQRLPGSLSPTPAQHRR